MIERTGGNFALLVTPFDEEGAIDEHSLRALVEYVVDGEGQGVVALGTTGEFSSLSEQERGIVASIVVDQASNRVPVFVGVGHAGTGLAVRLARDAEAIGADGLLLPPPYHQPISQPMVEAHIGAVAGAVSIGLMLYDGGGGIEIPAATIERLCERYRNIAAVKVSVLRAEKVAELTCLLGEDIALLCGDETMLMPELAMGAVGMSTASGSILPAICTEILDLFRSGDALAANELYLQVLAPWTIVSGITKTEFVRCFKEVLVTKGIIKTAYTRPPLLPLHPARLDNLVHSAKLLGILGS